MPQPTPDGRMAPALLTDDGITETVADEFPKWEGRRESPKKSEAGSCKSTSIRFFTERSCIYGVKNSKSRTV